MLWYQKMTVLFVAGYGDDSAANHTSATSTRSTDSSTHIQDITSQRNREGQRIESPQTNQFSQGITIVSVLTRSTYRAYLVPPSSPCKTTMAKSQSKP